MAGRIVLHVGILADLDPLIVAAQHRAEPYAGGILEPDAADHRGGVGDEIVSVAGKSGRLPVEFVDRHAAKISGSRRLWHRRIGQASTPAARSVMTTKVPDISLKKPASTVARMTISKRRRSILAPRSVLRMMMKGPENPKNGTAAKVFGA